MKLSIPNISVYIQIGEKNMDENVKAFLRGLHHGRFHMTPNGGNLMAYGEIVGVHVDNHCVTVHLMHTGTMDLETNGNRPHRHWYASEIAFIPEPDTIKYSDQEVQFIAGNNLVVLHKRAV